MQYERPERKVHGHVVDVGMQVRFRHHTSRLKLYQPGRFD